MTHVRNTHRDAYALEDWVSGPLSSVDVDTLKFLYTHSATLSVRKQLHAEFARRNQVSR